MTQRSRKPAPRRPTGDRADDRPLNPPDPPIEEQLRTLAGYRDADEQGEFAAADEIDTLSRTNATNIDEGDLDDGADQPTDTPEAEDLELLTELELRAEETDDPMEAVEEGFTYVPPIDPPVTPGSRDNAEIASGLAVSALDEPYDQDHHSSFLESDDEISARVREALRADSSTTEYADRITILTRDGRVILRGVVDDLIDSDNLLAVADYVEGVEEVLDELRVRGLE